MNYEALIWLVIAIVVSGGVFDLWLEHLNFKYSQRPLTGAAAEIYDQNKQNESLAYQDANYKLGVISSVLGLGAILLLLLFGLFGELHNRLGSFLNTRLGDSNEIVLALVFFAVLGIGSWLLDLPFVLYKNFVIEKKFGFNKMTFGTFISDTVKEFVVGGIIGGVILSVLILLYQSLAGWFWLTAWVAITGFSLLMLMFGTTVIMPLFNKFSDLPDGDLRTAIVDYCRTQGYEIGKMFVMDGSKRSTKANAFFAGIGPVKRIALYDTLIEQMTTEEVVSVVAHEVGHYKRKHIRTMLIMSATQTLVMTGLLGWLLNSDIAIHVLGGNQSAIFPPTPAPFHLSVVLFFLLFSPVSTLSSLIANTVSRANEFDADRFSIATYAGGHLRSALRKLATNNLSNVNPHPLYVKVHYSHPPVVERLAALPE